MHMPPLIYQSPGAAMLPAAPAPVAVFPVTPGLPQAREAGLLPYSRQGGRAASVSRGHCFLHASNIVFTETVPVLLQKGVL